MLDCFQDVKLDSGTSAPTHQNPSTLYPLKQDVHAQKRVWALRDGTIRSQSKPSHNEILEFL
jgi:hypothetical protein